MANSFYTPFKTRALGTGSASLVDFDADTIKAVGVDAADYTFSAAHDFFDDITSGGRVCSATISPGTITGSAGVGTVDFADWAFTAVTGDQFEEIIFYKDTGAEATSPLILRMDTFASGMPVLPNGGDINVAVNAAGLFDL